MSKKQPQDRKKKGAAERLRAEAGQMPGLEELASQELTIAGRAGEVTVQILENPLDWDAEVMSSLRDSDYLAAICGMLSTEDGQRLRAVRPSIGSLLEALMAPDDEAGESSLGEEQAS